MSGLIFAALAVAWAVYLIPKALRHHDEAARGRSVERFSDSVRVLARREPVSAKQARLVVGSRRSGEVETTPRPSSEVETRRARGAVKRRRRVLSLLVLALVAVVAACASHYLSWTYVAIPAALLVAWLVACRLMVKRERSAVRRTAPRSSETPRRSSETPRRSSETPRRSSEVETPSAESAVETTGRVPLVEPDEAAEGLWDPVPVTLPTYVSKPAARRSVRTIDLDATGVWTSGRSESDSALAREAEAADRVRRSSPRQADAGDEAVGS